MGGSTALGLVWTDAVPLLPSVVGLMVLRSGVSKCSALPLRGF